MSLRTRLRNLIHHTSPTTIRTFDQVSPARAVFELRPNPPALTPREQDVVRLILLGYSRKEIADELSITVGTVKWNITNILAKFDVGSTKRLIALLAAQHSSELRRWTIIE